MSTKAAVGWIYAFVVLAAILLLAQHACGWGVVLYDAVCWNDSTVAITRDYPPGFHSVSYTNTTAGLVPPEYSWDGLVDEREADGSCRIA